MATVTIKLPDEFMNQLSEFDSRLEDIFTKALEDGAEIAEKQARANLKAVIGSGTKLPSESTGQLLGALGISPVKPSELGGYDIRVGFAEPRQDGKSNEMIANIIEYGKKGHWDRVTVDGEETSNHQAGKIMMMYDHAYIDLTTGKLCDVLEESCNRKYVDMFISRTNAYMTMA